MKQTQAPTLTEQKRMFSGSRLSKQLCILLATTTLAASPALAQEAAPGDACTTEDIITRTGGPETSGVMNTMVCESSVWVNVWQRDGDSNFNVGGTGALTLPVGTDAQQPGTPAAGMLRYNSTDTAIEFWNGTAWVSYDGTGGVASAAGNNREIQFNDGGTALGAATNFVYTSAGDFIVGSYQLDDTGTGTEDNRMFYDVSKGAIRAGTVTNSYWNDVNVGNYSAAFGYGGHASGAASFAAGWGPAATGNASIALGSNANAHAQDSYAIGREVTVTSTGINSMGIGLGESSGADPQVSGADSLGIFMGDQAGVDLASSNTMAVLGGDFIVGSYQKEDTGTGNQDSRMFFDISKGAFRAGHEPGALWDDSNVGIYSVAMGRETRASGPTSTATGYETTASGEGSVAMGRITTASGYASTAIGRYLTASGNAAVTLGRNTTASGDYSMAIGLGIPTTTNPVVSGESSLGIFMGDQDGVDLAQANTMAIMGGQVGIGTVTPNASLVVEDNNTVQIGYNSGGNEFGIYATAYETGSGQSYGIYTRTTSNPSDAVTALSVNLNNAAGRGMQLGTGTATTGNLMEVWQSGSAMTSNAIQMHMADGSGTFTGNFLQFENNTDQMFYVDSTGEVGAVQYCDEDGNNCFTAAGISGSTPGGADREIQFNDSGAFGASSDFVYTSGGDLLLTGTHTGTPAVPVSGAGTRMFFHPAMSAFRAGSVNSSQWDDANIGEHSVAMGGNTNATGDYSFAVGNSTLANADSAMALGRASTASGLRSVAIGHEATASGDYSMSFGLGNQTGGNTTVSGESSLGIFMGDMAAAIDVATANTMAILGGDFIVGSYQLDDTTTGNQDYRMFYDASSGAFRTGMTTGDQWDSGNVGSLSFATGFNTTASGDTATALGRANTASGQYSTAMGQSTTASGSRSTAMGWGTLASGYAATAIGSSSRASGISSLALGSYAVAGSGTALDGAGDGSFAIGLMDDTVTITTRPTVTGIQSMGIFMGDQDGVDVTSSNTMALLGGTMVIDPSVPATETAASTGGEQDLELDVTGDIGAVNYCDEDGNNCFTAASVGSGSGVWQVTGGAGTELVTQIDASAPYATADFVFGSPQLANDADSDHYNRMFFDKSKGAFRAGYNDGGNWDDGNIGNRSVAMGYAVTASSSESIAFGRDVRSAGAASIAMGRKVYTTGDTSMVLGLGYATGTTPFVSGDNSFGIFMGDQSGIEVSSGNLMAILGGDFVVGSYQFDDTATGNQDSRMFFNLSKSAFRAGRTVYQAWDDANVGQDSFAAGYDTTASGQSSFAVGLGASATNYGAFASGVQTTASGGYSTAMGADTVASGQYSTAAGDHATASGEATTAFGRYTTASGNYATALGNYTSATSTAATALGNLTIASGASSTAMGREATASGEYSMAIGLGDATTTAPEVSGTSSLGIFMGDQDGIDVATANTMSVMGGDLIVGSYQLDDTDTGNQDYRMFFDVSKGAFRAGGVSGTRWDDADVGSNSVAFGSQTRASGAYSTATGHYTTASGAGSTAMGYNVISSGGNSVAIGLGVPTTTPPELSGDGSLAIFMGDQNNTVNLAAPDTVAMFGGSLLIDPAEPATQLTARATIDFGAATDAIVLPVGTTAQQPASPVAGMLRYNSTDSAIEFHDGSSWTSVGSGGAATAIDDLSDAVYDLSSQHNMVLGSNTAPIAGAINNLWIGEGAGGSTTTAADNNTAIGYQALSSNTSGRDNLAIGTGSLTANQSGNYNVSLHGLSNNTSGDGNIGIGNWALYSNVANDESTAVGYQAMRYANSTATGITTYNTALGAYALRGSTTAANNTGVWNTAIGHSALRNTTTGRWNTAVGKDALVDNTTGDWNTAVGEGALQANETGNQNTAIGDSSQWFTTGSRNTSLGYQALNVNTTGNNNLAIGYNVASTTLQTGDSNILIGTSAAVDTPAADTSNYLNIGGVFYGSMTTGEYTIAGTGALTLPVGTDAQQPGSPVAGMFRYNSTDTAIEFYNGASWVSYDGTATASAAGADRQIQFNDGGTALGADANFVYTSAGDFIVGSYQLDDTGTGSEDYRMFFDVSKGAFRVGQASGTQWNDANVGTRSIALGADAMASGGQSVAMGYNTTASNLYSTAMGEGTTASGQSSVAMGAYTIASGSMSTAMGHGTTASGNRSTAIGRDATASGDYSVAIGMADAAGTDPVVSGEGSLGIFMGDQSGIDVATANTMAILGGDFIVGSYQLDDTTTGNQDNHMFFDTSKAAFRAGTVWGTQWDDEHVGDQSFASGLNTTASQDYATAMGSYTTASGNSSVAVGREATASGNYSMAIGLGNATTTAPEVSGDSSLGIFMDDQDGIDVATANTMAVLGGDFIVGSYQLDDTTTGNQDYRMFFDVSKGAFRAGIADGTQWNDSNVGSGSTAIGVGTTASGMYSTAMGINTTASGYGCTAMGYNNTASNWYSTTMGYQTAASGMYSTAIGRETTASNEASTAMGYNTTASGSSSTAMGYNTTASSSSSTATGRDTTASGMYSTAMGYNTTASGSSSTAMGYNTTASGIYSIALGRETTTSGSYSTAMGREVTVGNGTVGSGYGDASIGFGLVDGSVTDDPNITGVQSMGIFMGAQEGVDVASANTLALLGGVMVIDPSVPATQTSASTGGEQDLELDVEGDIGAVNYCDEDGNNCFTAASVGGAGGTPAGSDLQIQFNDNGSFGAATNFVYTSAGDFIVGSYQLDDTGTGSEDYRMFFDVSKGAFRSGGGNGNQWDDANVGDYSAVLGYNTIASGEASVAVGHTSTASGSSAFAAGYANTASGNNSVAMGRGVTASGGESVAMGYGTVASGGTSVALGSYTTASWNSAFAVGASTTASGGYSTAMGNEATASGNYSMAIGLGDATTTAPEVSGASSLGIFMGDQDSVDLAQANTMAIMGGQVGIGTVTPTGNLDIITTDNNTDSILRIGSGVDNSNTANSAIQLRESNVGAYDRGVDLLYNGDAGDHFSIQVLNSATPTEVFRIERASGEIGIGDFSSDTVDSALHIASGDIRLDGGAGNQAGCLRFNDTTDMLQYSHDCSTFSNLGTATASAAGNDTEIQFNDGGTALGASSRLTWDGTNLFVSNGTGDGIYIGESGGNTSYMTAWYDEFMITTVGNATDSIIFNVDSNGDETPNEAMRITGAGDLIVGSYQLDDTTTGNQDNRMFYDVSKAAFRAGGTSGTQWDDANVGINSVGMGGDTTASGAIAVAMGESTTASGDVSTALGYYSVASGDASTATGDHSTASGLSSTALGAYTVASGEGSTAIGSTTTASGLVSTAMGYEAVASGTASMAIGLGDATTTAPEVSGAASLGIFMGDQDGIDVATANTMAVLGGDFIVGSYQLDDTTTGNQDYRMFFDVSKGAFRAGYATGTQWDDANVGANSTAFGLSTTASGSRSMATGQETAASGDWSVASGRSTIASGDYSMAFSRRAVASGANSVAFGLGYASSYPEVSGASSFGIFMGDQNGVDITSSNTLALLGGAMVIDPDTTSATNTAASTGGEQDLELDVEGDIGAVNYCDEDGNNCFTAASVGSGSGVWQVTGGAGSEVVSTVDATAPYATSDFVFGSSQLDEQSGTADDNIRMFFDKGIGAFRAGNTANTSSWNNASLGNYSFAAGTNTEASGTAAVALGSNTIASNTASTALGQEVTASGAYSVAIGAGNAGGTRPEVSGDSSIGIFMGDQNSLDVATANTMAVLGGDFIVGSYQLDDTTTGNQDNHMFFDTSKAAFRAGTVWGTQWDDEHVGDQSFASGLNTTASQDYATAMGSYTTASGNSSVAVGREATASGNYSMAIGLGNATTTAPEVSGASSLGIFMGDQDGIDVATANTMAVLGGDFIVGSYQTADTATGNQDYRMFFDSSKGAFRAGYVDAAQWDDTNVGNYSIALGEGTVASGQGSIALGSVTTASANTSIAMGYNTTASGFAGTAMGEGTIASGYASAAMGWGARASGIGSAAIGLTAIAGSGTAGDGAGDGSVAFGLIDNAVTITTAPTVTGIQSMGIFMGDQDGVDVSSSNTMALLGGRMVIDPAVPATNTAASTGGEQDLELDVEGDIGAVNYCDEDGNNCFTAASVGSGSSTLGTAADATSPYRSGDVTTGLYTDAAGAVSVSSAGTESLRVDADGVYNSTAFSVTLHNTSFGYTALGGISTGDENTAFGYHSLTNVSTGVNNTAIGGGSLYSGNGSYNTAVGAASMYSTTGNSNTAVGFDTLRYNTSGAGNTAIGGEALNDLATGSNNTAVGRGAMNGTFGNGLTGSYNTGLGYRSLYVLQTTAANNTALGTLSGGGVTTGSNNIFIGYQAGDNVTTGGNNIIIGYDINAASATGSDQLNIGNLIYGNMDTDQIAINTNTGVSANTDITLLLGGGMLAFGDGSQRSDIASVHYGTTASEGGSLVAMRGRGSSSSPAIVQNGDRIGTVSFAAFDSGASYSIGATIFADVAGTPGVDDMPTRLEFHVAADGEEVDTATDTPEMVITPDGDLIVGSDQLDDTGTGNEDYRMFFDRSKGAFRAGQATSTDWDDSLVGINSFATGYDTRASGDYSTALGWDTWATGNNSTSIGSYTVASGEYSIALGREATASGQHSMAIGLGNSLVPAPIVSGSGSLGIFLGEQSETDLDGDEILGIFGGHVIIDPSNPVTDTAPSTGGEQDLELDVEGDIGAVNYCDEDGNNCFTAASVGSGSSTLGTAADATSPYRSGDVTTGLYSDAAGAVSVSSAGTESLRVDADGVYNSTASVTLHNTSFGYTALGGVSTGDENTAFGYHSLTNVSTGVNNTAIGGGSLYSGNSSYNTAVGAASMYATTGNANTAVGFDTLRYNTSGANNTAIGGEALNNLATGSNNTAIGRGALNGTFGNGLTGSYNTGLGYRALYALQTTAANNTALGTLSGGGVTTGSNNIFIGYQAGDNVTTGGNNIIIGYDINAASATGSDQLNIGGTIVGDMDTGQIAINDTAVSLNPAIKLQVHGATISYGNASLAADIGSIMNSATATDAGHFVAMRGRGTTGTPASVQDGDQIGRYSFVAYTGAASYSTGAVILAEVDGTPGVGDMPTTLEFHVANDGEEVNTATDVPEMVITPAGDLIVGSDQLDDTTTGNEDYRMFFDKSKGAFRAGGVQGTQWNAANVGDYSIALGGDTTASAAGSVALGVDTTASAQYATAMGATTQATAQYATSMGADTTASGIASVAMGNSTIASGDGSLAIGLIDDGVTITTRPEVSGMQSMGIFMGDQDGVDVSSGNTFAILGGNVVIDPTVPATTTATSYALEVVGDAAKDTGTAWTSSSDIRLKDIHGDYEKGLDEIMTLHPVKFTYKKDNPRHHNSELQHVGFIAQEVQGAFPEAVHEGADGYLDFNIHPISIAMVSAVQDLKAENDNQNSELDLVKAENETLKAEIASMHNSLEDISKQVAVLNTAAGNNVGKASMFSYIWAFFGMVAGFGLSFLFGRKYTWRKG